MALGTGEATAIRHQQEALSGYTVRQPFNPSADANCMCFASVRCRGTPGRKLVKLDGQKLTKTFGWHCDDGHAVKIYVFPLGLTIVLHALQNDNVRWPCGARSCTSAPHQERHLGRLRKLHLLLVCPCSVKLPCLCTKMELSAKLISEVGFFGTSTTPCFIFESHNWRPLIGDWNRGSDCSLSSTRSTFRPDSKATIQPIG